MKVAEVMENVAEWGAKIPFQRAIDRNLSDIEALLFDGYTFRALSLALSDRGFRLPDGSSVSAAYLGGAVSRARRKKAAGSRLAGTAPAPTVPGRAVAKPLAAPVATPTPIVTSPPAQPAPHNPNVRRGPSFESLAGTRLPPKGVPKP